MVPEKGLEPSRPCEHMDLNHACLPIPPLRQTHVEYTRKSAEESKKTQKLIITSISSKRPNKATFNKPMSISFCKLSLLATGLKISSDRVADTSERRKTGLFTTSEWHHFHSSFMEAQSVMANCLDMEYNGHQNTGTGSGGKRHVAQRTK